MRGFAREIRETNDGRTRSTYDAANEQIRFNSATPNLVYDNNGNLTSFTDASGTTTYTWNARNQLTALSGPSLSASFGYDGLGRRKSKTFNSTTTGYWYDGNDILAELSGSSVTASYVRSLSIDEPFIRKGASDEFYQTDALGSAFALTDSAGATQTTYTYEPFGKTSVSGTSTNSFQYTGREYDGTGLYYYRKRYYNPVVSRFIGEDPLYSPLEKSTTCRGKYAPSVYDLIEVDTALAPLLRFRYVIAAMAMGFNAQRLHAYSYADNTPLNKLDPMGLISAPPAPGCDRVWPVAQFLSCAFDCCDAHDRCYERAPSRCDETSWDSRDRSKRPDCWECNMAVLRCFNKNATNVGSRKPCDVSRFPY